MGSWGEYHNHYGHTSVVHSYYAFGSSSGREAPARAVRSLEAS